jgi:hypothetical protein
MGDGKKEATTPNDLANMTVATEVAKDALNKFLLDSQPATYNSTIQQTAKGMNVDTTSNRGPGSHMEIHKRPEDTGYNNGWIDQTYRAGFDIYQRDPRQRRQTCAHVGASKRRTDKHSKRLGLEWYGYSSQF